MLSTTNLTSSFPDLKAALAGDFDDRVEYLTVAFPKAQFAHLVFETVAVEDLRNGK